MTRKLIAVLSLAALSFAGWLFYGPIPPIDSSRFTSVAILDRNGVPLSEPLSRLGERGQWLASSAIPQRVAMATVAAEDRRFYRHFGIDPLAIGRAAVHDVRRRALVEGGSTITQQVAKLMIAGEGPSSRGIATKIREAILALRLERRYTKRAILAAYVNLAPYGNQIRGVAGASRRYFGCASEDLTIAQAAFLASLPQRPSAFNPLRDPQRAVVRQQSVLRRMRELGFVSRGECETALHERLRFRSGGRERPAQHFIERVLERPTSKDSRTLVTTLDSVLQREVAEIIAAHREDLLRHGAHSAAVAVLDNATGEWLAWEGSGDYFGTTFGGAIDGVIALRQPGSTLKPFTYALAFERGDSPATVLADVPSSFPTAEEGVVYTPRNYDGRYRGPLRARNALAGSENVPAVALLAHVGAPALLRLLRSAGFTDLHHSAEYYGLGLTLGDAEVRLDQLVVAYAMLARGGLRIDTTMIRGERSAGTGERPAAQAAGLRLSRRVISARTAFWITDILSDPSARQFIFGSGGSLDFPFAVAVKTGTSQAYHDNWTVGYTRAITVGVWVGNFDREVLRNSSGITGAAPIFHDVMIAAMKRAGARSDDLAPIVEPPPDVVRVPVCALSGLRPSTSCPAVESEWVAVDAPVRFCSWHHGDSVTWPDEYRSWARANGLLDVTHPPADTRRTRVATRLRIVDPPNGATYLIDPTLRMPYQSLHLRAISTSAVAWHIDSRRIAVVPRDATAEWPLKAGQHTITAVDDDGNRASVRVFVK